MDWLEYMEWEFFTDDLHKRLTEFLKGQGILNGEDPDKWGSLFNSTRQWRAEYMKSSEELHLASYFAWNINVTAAEFEIPESSDTAEIMKKLFLAVWLLDIDSDEREKECMCRSGFEFEFECDLQYPKEKCAKLTKARLSEELREIYDKSYDRLCDYRQRKDSNPEYTAWVEPSYPVFMRYIKEFESIGDIEAVRLNEFDCDQYVWYIIKDGERIRFVQISDFG
ncbi:MAG: hypothetical protein K2J80_00180 [Oscillospiraceae bacterium]|nr:hypothetical protein [Oscillospiraceae bacterium]